MPSSLPPLSAFTLKATGIARVLESRVKVTESANPSTSPVSDNDFLAIWDTGATNSVITKKVVDALGLAPTGIVEVHGVHGKDDRYKYIVSIQLPNNIRVRDIEVTDGELGGADVLIGMDIIALGDFAVSNYQGKTTFTFRTPSYAETDYVALINKFNEEGDKYAPCPCGSGKKWKFCHGNKS